MQHSAPSAPVSRDGYPPVAISSVSAEITLPDRANPRDTRTYTRTRGSFREAFHYTELGDCILAGRSTEQVSHTIGRLRWSILAAGGALLAAGLGGGWWLTSRAIRPIEKLAAEDKVPDWMARAVLGNAPRRPLAARHRRENEARR